MGEDWYVVSLENESALPLTFNLVAVSGSISNLISFASWLILGPTSAAPVRMTMLLGDAAVPDVA